MQNIIFNLFNNNPCLDIASIENIRYDINGLEDRLQEHIKYCENYLQEKITKNDGITDMNDISEAYRFFIHAFSNIWTYRTINRVSLKKPFGNIEGGWFMEDHVDNAIKEMNQIAGEAILYQPFGVNSNYYVTPLIFARNLFGNNLEGRTIVEIGASPLGIVVLGQMSDMGARCIAINSAEYHNSKFEEFNNNVAKERNIDMRCGRWEELSRSLDQSSVDMIYTAFMDPHPEAGGRFERENYFSCGTDNKKLQTELNLEKEFETYIFTEMAKILKPNGIYLSVHEINKFNPHSEYYVRHVDSYLGQRFIPHNFHDMKRCKFSVYQSSAKLRMISETVEKEFLFKES